MNTPMTTNDAVLEVLRRSLEEGHTVEIEGLGTFRRAADRRYHFAAQSRPQVFVAYVAEDLALARRVCAALRAANCSP